MTLKYLLISGEYTVEAETSSAISSWYMGFRYSMQNGAFKGYKSYDSGSTWSLVVSGTHAAYADALEIGIITAFPSPFHRLHPGFPYLPDLRDDSDWRPDFVRYCVEIRS